MYICSVLKLTTGANAGATDGEGRGEPDGSSSYPVNGVGLGLGSARLWAMKLIEFPSGDQATVSGNTQERSGGIRLRRNRPSLLYRSMRNAELDSSSVP